MTVEYIDIAMIGVPWYPYPRDIAGWESWSWIGKSVTGEYTDIVMVGVPWCPYPRDTAGWESWSWAGRGRARGRSSLGTPKGRDANLEDMINMWQPFMDKIFFVGILISVLHLSIHSSPHSYIHISIH